jgi:hypothetical protein
VDSISTSERAVLRAVFDEKRGDEKMQTTIGQRILAAVLAHQVGISTDRALKLYVQGREIDPSWEQAGETLLRSANESTSVQGRLRPARGPQIVRRKSV